MIRLEDNTPKSFSLSPEREGIRLIANQSVESLIGKHPELLVFPQCLNDCKDDLKRQFILSLSEDVDTDENRVMHVTPTNLVGYIGVKGTNISITSRFSSGEGVDKDYFLHYLLQKTLSVNLFDLEHGFSKDDQVFDFLLLLFPGMLKQALAQGLYKEYRTCDRNDANVKGRIDVARHLQRNMPFNGRVAYQSREISYDNSVTQLIRHTIEHIRISPFGQTLLSNDSEISECVDQIIAATPSYTKGERGIVMRKNNKPVSHPYFTKYKPLQVLCLRILHHEKIRYSDTQNKVYGILFDMSWLWEEYLATLLPDYDHPKNREGIGAIYLGRSGAMERYPDFYKGESGGIVLDAKYKNEIDRNDQHQVISYMYRLQSRHGGFLLPSRESKTKRYTDLLGYGFRLGRHYLTIPNKVASYAVFCEQIVPKQDAFISEIEKL